LDGSDVEIDVDEEVARIEETRRTGPGRPPTTWEHMSRRAKREEKTRVQKEEERGERKATEALSCSAPKGRKWRKIKEEEEEIEAELIDAPTADITSKMIEQSVRVFKIADCSNNMKGSLVRELQGAAALMRAATSVMATRPKGASGGRDVEELFKTIEELRAENVRLKREMEQVKARLPPPTVPQPAALERRSSTKRRRVVEWTDSEEEGKS